MADLIQDKVKDLLEFASRHGLMEVSWQQGDAKVSFRRNPSTVKAAPPVPGDVPAAPAVEDVVIKSPMVGTFRRGGSKNHPPLVMEGNHVKPGERMGIVECMKIPTDVVSYCKGQIKKILVEDGQAVEYGQPLFILIEEPVDGAEKN